jgi:hypothetical protein
MRAGAARAEAGVTKRIPATARERANMAADLDCTARFAARTQTGEPKLPRVTLADRCPTRGYLCFS